MQSNVLLLYFPFTAESPAWELKGVSFVSFARHQTRDCPLYPGVTEAMRSQFDYERFLESKTTTVV